MSLVFWKITDATDGDVTPKDIFPAYWGHLICASPSGNYAMGEYLTSGNSTAYVVDTSVRPPLLKWKEDVYLGNLPIGIADFADPKAIDDEGSLWADSGDNSGRILEFPLATPANPVAAFSWTDDNGNAAGLTALFIRTLTASDGTIYVVMIPEGTTGHDNTLVFIGTKGVTGLIEYDLSTWVAWDAFLDDNDDLWIAGAPAGNTHTTLNLKRLTDVTGSSPYTTPISVTMPADGQFPRGYFASGAYVGAWGEVTQQASYFFKIDLTAGTVTTRDITASPVYLTADYPSAVPPNPTHYFYLSAASWSGSGLQTANADQNRTITDLLPDLTDGQSFNLNDWGADDGPVDPNDPETITQFPFYLDGQTAFIATRHYSNDGVTDDQIGDFFLYAFAGNDVGGTGGTSESRRLRTWAFSLDGHDFIVLRVGASGTFIYDIATGKWSDWRSPGLINWRAHVGQNWVGMTGALSDGATDIVAGDDQSGVLWRLDPTKGRDDRTDTGDDSFTRTVTGGFALDGREARPCNALELTVSLGVPSQTGAAFTLTTSDDLGQTTINHGTQTVAAGDYSAVVEWRGLGMARAPGRIFTISDDGAAVRLGRADLR